MDIIRLLNKKSRSFARTSLDIVGLKELKDLVPPEDAPSFIDVVHDIVMPNSNESHYLFEPTPDSVRSPLIALTTALCGNRIKVRDFAILWLNDRNQSISHLKHPEKFPEKCDETTAINELFDILIANSIIQKLTSSENLTLDSLLNIATITKRPIYNSILLAWNIVKKNVPFTDVNLENTSQALFSNQFLESLNSKLEPLNIEITIFSFGDDEWLAIRDL